RPSPSTYSSCSWRSPSWRSAQRACIGSCKSETSRLRANLRPRPNGTPTVVGDLLQAPRRALGHAPSTVERELAALFEHPSNAHAPTLDARLHSGERHPEHARGVLVREPFELGQGDGFSIGGREARD